jgi:DNA-binding transcriptional LysR family regulator
MLKLENVSVFVTIVSVGSISEAARRVGLPRSVVSERLLDLERELGTRLLQRTTRKLSITADGAAFLTRARKILAEADAAVAEVSERQGKLTGPLRLSGPVTFGTLHLAPALCSFLAAHPGIDLLLDLDDRFVDIAADGYDAVVRHGPIVDQRVVVKRLARSQRCLVAAPAYLQAVGAPQTVAELSRHRGILYSHRETDWRFQLQDRTHVIRPERALRFNNGLLMRDAALAGLGVALLPRFAIHRELAAGSLLELPLAPGWEAEGAEIYLAYPSEGPTSAKLRALVEHLRQCLGTPPYWEA